MKKKEAFQLAKKFRSDHPELAGRSVRFTESPASGFNSYTVQKLVPVGPRGGMQPTRRLNSATNGTMITSVYAGAVIMSIDYINGWPNYNSRPILPHEEDGVYAGDQWKPEFTEQEKLTSIAWAREHLPLEPWEDSNLDELEHNLKNKLEWKLDQESMEEDWRNSAR